MINRHTDVASTAQLPRLPVLPVIDWGSINQAAPVHHQVDYKGPDAPLPEADVVVITWTAAEWSAFDHVFLSSDTTRSRYQRDFEKEWHRYSHKAPEIHSKFKSSPLWGYYRMVTIKGADGKDRRVLLFKSDAHLAHPNWIDALVAMTEQILAETKAPLIYTIGTGGGSSVAERLGDTCITNSGYIWLKKPANTHVDWNNSTILCDTWFPPTDLLAEVEKNLLFPLNRAASEAELEHLLDRLHAELADSKEYQLKDFLNEALDPKNLEVPKGLNKKGIPLLTTDFYYIAQGDDAEKYCMLEMDDTVIGYAAQKAGVEFAFVRNVSDPVVPLKDSSGEVIPSDVRDGWSGLIYQTFGLYTSFNGALVTWATIAALTD